MRKLAITFIYLISVVVTITYLLLDIIGQHKLSNLNLTLLILLTIFTSVIYGELVIKHSDHARKNKEI